MIHLVEKIAVIAIASILIIPGAYKLSYYGLVVKRSNLHTGIITKQGLGRFIGCKPMIEFYDKNGQKREFKSEINYHFFFCPKVGEKVKVFSEKMNPAKTHTFSIVHFIVIPVILLGVGMFVLYFTFFKNY